MQSFVSYKIVFVTDVSSVVMMVKKNLLLAMAPEILAGDGGRVGKHPKRKVVMKTAASISLSYETKVQSTSRRQRMAPRLK